MDTISVNLNRELAAKAKPILSYYGIDIETALNVYLSQVIASTDLKLQVNTQTEYVRPEFKFGCLKGIIDIDNNFDDVLADFEEYM